jgi:hypothetical protein
LALYYTVEAVFALKPSSFPGSFFDSYLLLKPQARSARVLASTAAEQELKDYGVFIIN